LQQGDSVANGWKVKVAEEVLAAGHEMPTGANGQKNRVFLLDEGHKRLSGTLREYSRVWPMHMILKTTWQKHLRALLLWRDGREAAWARERRCDHQRATTTAS
jgi:hypothetical protein